MDMDLEDMEGMGVSKFIEEKLADKNWLNYLFDNYMFFYIVSNINKIKKVSI